MSFSLHSPSPFLRDVRHPALAFRIGSAGKALRGDDAAKEISRAVTFRAMTEAVDQIGAAIPPRRTRRIRHKGLAVHEQQFPDSDVAPDIERKRHVVIAHLAGDRRERFQVGEEVADVFNFGMRVGRIGKSRKIVSASRRNASCHRIDEIRLGPSPDAIGRIGRDVRGVESAERRWNGKSAAEPQAIGLAGHGMAGGTSPGVECCQPVGGIGRGRWRGRRNDRGARRRQPPENAEGDGAGQHGAKENSSQHSPIRHYPPETIG